MTSPPKPIAEGSLTTAPFAHVLISAMRKQLDGTLAVWPDEQRPGQDRILFDQGTPVAARFLDPPANLERGILSLFHRSKAPYAFYAIDLVGDKSNVLRGSLDPLGLITVALRANVREDSINEVLRRLGDKPQRIKRTAPLARLALSPKELAFIDLIRADPSPPKTLIDSFGDPQLARRMIYLLGITDSLEAYERAGSRSRLREQKLSPAELERPSMPTTPRISTGRFSPATFSITTRDASSRNLDVLAFDERHGTSTKNSVERNHRSQRSTAESTTRAFTGSKKTLDGHLSLFGAARSPELLRDARCQRGGFSRRYS